MAREGYVSSMKCKMLFLSQGKITGRSYRLMSTIGCQFRESRRKKWGGDNGHCLFICLHVHSEDNILALPLPDITAPCNSASQGRKEATPRALSGIRVMLYCLHHWPIVCSKALCMWILQTQTSRPEKTAPKSSDRSKVIANWRNYLDSQFTSKTHAPLLSYLQINR